MPKRRRRTVHGAIVFLVAACCLVCAWRVGLVGRILVGGLRFLTPLTIGHGLRITAVRHGPRRNPRAAVPGLLVVANPHRLRHMVRGLLPHPWLLPPGLIRHGLVLEGDWNPTDLPLPDRPVPWALLCSTQGGPHPRLQFRGAPENLTALHDHWRRDDLVHEEEYLFGHYLVTEEYTFTEFRLVSEPPPDSRERRFTFRARGRVRYRIDENYFIIKATAIVRRLSGLVLLRHRTDDTGTQLAYDILIDRIDANARRFPWFVDRKLERALRRSFQRSLNRERKKEKLARKRLPAWIPMDLVIDIQLAE